MATPCNCDTFTSPVTITVPGSDPQLVVQGYPAGVIRVFPSTGSPTGSLEAFTTTDPSMTGPWSRVRLTADGTTGAVIADAGNGGSPLPVAVQTGGAERLRIDVVGNVGIGTMSPGARLDVQGGNVHMGGTLQVDGPVYAVAAPGQGDAFFIGNDAKLVDINVANTAGWYGQADSTVGSLQLGSGGPTLTGNGGNLGIGVAAPAARLHLKADFPYVMALVDTATAAEASHLALGEAGALIWQIYKPANSHDLRFFRSDKGDQVTIQDGTGYVGIGTISPEQALDVVGNVHATGSLAAGSRTIADGNGCYYA